MSDKELIAAIAVVNTYNRPKGKKLVSAVKCDCCGKLHARVEGNVSHAKLQETRIICPNAECQRGARRERQSERRRLNREPRQAGSI